MPAVHSAKASTNQNPARSRVANAGDDDFDRKQPMPPRASQPAMRAGEKMWSVKWRPIGDTGPGEQATPSTFKGTEAEAQQWAREQTAATQRPGAGPAREFLVEPA